MGITLLFKFQLQPFGLADTLLPEMMRLLSILFDQSRKECAGAQREPDMDQHL